MYKLVSSTSTYARGFQEQIKINHSKHLVLTDTLFLNCKLLLNLILADNWDLLSWCFIIPASMSGGKRHVSVNSHFRYVVNII